MDGWMDVESKSLCASTVQKSKWKLDYMDAVLRKCRTHKGSAPSGGVSVKWRGTMHSRSTVELQGWLENDCRLMGCPL